jgi:hypothetical protein
MPFINPEKYKEYQESYHAQPNHRKTAAERSRKHYQDNKEHHIQNCVRRQKAWTVWARENDPKALMLKRTKNSALTRKIECTITKDDFEIPEYCPILGIKLVLNIGKPRSNSPSMDRIDNNKGYIPGNVCVISKEANRLKSNLTKESLEKLLDYVSNPDKYRKILDS